MRIIDISLPLSETMVVWPGDEPFHRDLASSIARGGAYNLSRLRLCAHAGTHVDAPLHFIDGGASVDALDPSVFIGPCRVAAIRNRKAIDAADLRALDLAGVERLLLKTANSALHGRPDFVVDYVALTLEAARYLVTLDALRLIGVDYYSVAPYGELYSVPVHTTLLGRPIIVLEGLNLNGVAPGDYELISLPLRIEGAEGSPVRAVLVQR
jgi:arylformamidase